jgi:hypothetical protein
MNEMQTEVQIVIVQNDVQLKFLQKQHVEMVLLNEKNNVIYEQIKTEKTITIVQQIVKKKIHVQTAE